MKTNKILSKEQSETLLKTLKERFQKNEKCHPGMSWEKVENSLLKNAQKLWSVFQMEESGGEPDVVILNNQATDIIFVDCSKETPKGRRSICYDRKALESRKAHRPENTALDMANDMGIELLSEEEYFLLQKYGPFDTKTSSWLKTSDDVRSLGGAIFGDYRFGRVFIYHNGADSYYGVRGFRGKLVL